MPYLQQSNGSRKPGQAIDVAKDLATPSHLYTQGAKGVPPLGGTLSSRVEMEKLIYTLFCEESVVKPALVFTRTKKLAEQAAATLRGNLGLKAEHAHSNVPEKRRAEMLEELRAGELDVVCCTDVWMAGVDIPHLGAVVLACGGSAPIGLLQRLGRGLRRPDGKTSCQIWDLAAWNDSRQDDRLAVLAGQGVQVTPRKVKRTAKRQRKAERKEVEQRTELREWIEAQEVAHKQATDDLLMSLLGTVFGLTLIGVVYALCRYIFAALKGLP